jgi:hypothetical protein
VGDPVQKEMRTLAPDDLDSVLVSEDFRCNPYPVLKLLREQHPVYWSDSIGGWIVTRYNDILATFRSFDQYSNEGRLARAVEHLSPESRCRLAQFQDHYRTRGLLHSDPPDHTRLRALVTKAFSGPVVESLRPRMQELADGIIDRALQQGGMEIISELAVALPIRVLADLLGAPPEDCWRFKHWADVLLSFQGVNKPAEEILQRAQSALLEIRAYLTDLIATYRKQPGENLLSRLVRAESDGDKLSESELLNTCITLLVAGHETSTSLIGNGLYLLLSHPDAWSQLVHDPALLSPAIEEILRFESPVARQPRLMKAGAELGGETIRQGEMIFQMLNSANRDEAQFENPDTFDIRRRNNRHIAFGSGIHFCVGAVLARVEAQVVLGTLLRRTPTMRLIDQAPAWDVHKPNSRMLKQLQVSL